MSKTRWEVKMKEIKLNHGSVRTYDFDAITLRAYETKNPLNEVCFILEKGDRLVIIELVSFFHNMNEIEEYVRSLKKEIDGVIIAYHAAGGTLFKNVRKYSTKEAVEYAKNGHGKAMVNDFSAAFGKDFDATTAEITDIISDGNINVGGIDFFVKCNREAFDIEIPEINALYTHMLGADCHSIIAGENQADSLISDLKNCLVKKYDLILTSHHAPEDLCAVETKIAYLERIKTLAKTSASAQDFKDKVKREYPDYLGENYLGMTASLLFK
jgi:hypothetical protein